MISEFLSRLRFFFFRKSQGEFEEEMQFHLEEAIAAKVASGMDPAEARRQAQIEFGGVEAVREQTNEQRPGWWLDTLAQDVRYALRGFRRSPLFSLTALLTLALAIGATAAVFSVVDRILFRPLPYAHDEQLVSVGLSQPLEKQEFTLGGFYFEWRDHQKPFQVMTYERGVDECNLTEANPVRLHCGRVAANFLPTLGIVPVLGRNFLAEEDAPNAPQAALISDGLWQARFNRSRDILNKTIEIDGKPIRMIGVLPLEFEMPRLQAVDILLPAQVDVTAQHTVNAGIGVPLWAFARMKRGVTVAQAREQMNPIFLHTQMWIPEQFRSQFHLQVRSLRDRQLQDAYRVAWVLLGAAIAMLLIACANVANLFSARGAARARELAVRSALGATRLRILRQSLTEALLLAIAGAALGCMMAEGLLRIFLSIAPASVPFLAQARLDLRIIGFAILLALGCTILCGLLPALEQPSITALNTRAANSHAHARVRRLLVATQIAISIVLLSGAGLFVKSLRHLQREDLGMQTTHVLDVRIPLAEARYQGRDAYMNFALRAETAMRAIPGVQAVSLSDSVPPDANSWHDGHRYADIFVEGRSPIPPETGGSVVRRQVTPDYLRVLHIPILEGRGFTEAERNQDSHLLVLSKQLATRLFPQGNAVGQHIRFASYVPRFALNGPVFTVVGVAGDVKNAGLTGQDEPEYYQLWSSRQPDTWGRHSVYMLETVLPAGVVASWLRTQIGGIDPTAPVEIQPMTRAVASLADRPRFEAALVSFFAICGLILAVIGLYGVIALIAAQRTLETGIRMALGATPGDILLQIGGEGMRLIALGGVVGLAVALVEVRLLRGLLFGVSPYDLGTYLAVVVLLVAVALLAIVLPVRRAMRVDPAVALRSE
jgi:putative ABC transport system permease protein